MGLIQNTKHSLKEAYRILKECHSLNAILDCSLVVWIKQFMSYFFHFKTKFKQPPFIKRSYEEDLEVLQKEGLMDVSMISQYFRSHFKSRYCNKNSSNKNSINKNSINKNGSNILFVFLGKKHSKHHIDDLVAVLKKAGRRCPTHIEIKGPTYSFKFIIKTMSQKYLEISNIIKKSSNNGSGSSNNGSGSSNNGSGNNGSGNNNYNYYNSKCLDGKGNSIYPNKGLTKHLNSNYYHSKRFNTIDLITFYDKNNDTYNLSSPKASIIKFYTLYGDYILKKNVSWYSNPLFKKNVSWYSNPPLEYKVLVGTDIAESTRLWNASKEGMSVAITKHDYLTLELLEKCGGVFSRNEGDGFYLFFRTIEGATRFALLMKKHGEKIQISNNNHKFEYLKIKIAIYTGEVQMSDSRNLNCMGEPIARINEMLAHSSHTKICISRRILNKHTERVPSLFCIH